MADPGPDETNEFNRSLITEFRANDGKVGGAFAGAPLLLLTTTGAKTGRSRTTPVVYVRDGDRLIVFASKAGSPTNPAWYHNLVAHRTATVELGTDRFEVEAHVTTGDERDRLFREQAERMPQFSEYAAKTTRQIPVIALTRS